MKEHDLSGKTAAEAIEFIEKTTGTKVTPEVKSILEQVAKIDGGRIKALLLADNGEGYPKELDATELQLQAENAELRNDPITGALFKEHGEPGPYNGVPGDSCRCDICTLRRRVLSVILTEDMDKGMRAPQVMDNLTRGYGGLDKIPAWATVEHLAAFVDAVGNVAAAKPMPLDTIKSFKSSAAKGREATTARARNAFVKAFGEGSPQLARFDEMEELMAKRDGGNLGRKIEIMLALDEDMKRMEELAAAAERTAASFINAPQRFTQ